MPTKTTVLPSALILNPPQADHWQLGQGKASARFGAADLNPSGDWSAYAPKDEDQSVPGFDTQNCTNYGTGKALIALSKALVTLANFRGFTEFPSDISERYTGVLTGTTPIGNDPHHVIEVIRTFAGVIPAEVLPWSESIRSWEEYYSPNPMAEEFVALGQKILKKFTIGHEWVWTGNDPKKHEKLAAALKRGTVCVSVRAWQKKGAVYIKEPGETDNHWVWLMKIDEKGRPVVRDQYAPYEKKLAKDYDFQAAKLYFMSPNLTGQTPFNLTYLMNLLKQLLARLRQPREHRLDVPVEAPELPVEPPPAPKPAPVPPKPKGIDYGQWPELVKAIIQVESGGLDTAVGDKHLTDKAYGCMQIRRPVCIDVNRVYGTNLTPLAMFDRQLSIDTFYKYMSIYATKKQIGREVTHQDRARIWNGGPSGWKRSTTVGYWAKISKHL